MKVIQRTSQFKKDVKRLQKRGKDMALLKDTILCLASNKSLEVKYRDHALVGNYYGTRECHINPDWLLLYRISEDDLILIRTGTHADLFE
jgi:mRNA interferase YafQ